PPSADCNAGDGLRRDKFRLRPTAMPVTGSGATSSAFARRNGVSGFGGTSAHPDVHRPDTGERQGVVRRGTDESRIDPGRLDAAGPGKLAGLEAFLAEDRPPLRRLERHRRLLATGRARGE